MVGKPRSTNRRSTANSYWLGRRNVTGHNARGASAVEFGFGKENASAVIKALEEEVGVAVKARAASQLTPSRLPRRREY